MAPSVAHTPPPGSGQRGAAKPGEKHAVKLMWLEAGSNCVVGVQQERHAMQQAILRLPVVKGNPEASRLPNPFHDLLTNAVLHLLSCTVSMALMVGIVLCSHMLKTVPLNATI